MGILIIRRKKDINKAVMAERGIVLVYQNLQGEHFEYLKYNGCEYTRLSLRRGLLSSKKTFTNLADAKKNIVINHF